MSTPSSRLQNGSMTSGQRGEVTSSSCLSGTKQTWKRNGVAEWSQSYIMNETSTTCQGRVSQRCTGEMGLVLFFGLQANHDRGRRAESQRAECHVHRDQCQDRLQCQTGDPCSPPTFLHIWSTCLPDGDTDVGLQDWRKHNLTASGSFAWVLKHKIELVYVVFAIL